MKCIKNVKFIFYLLFLYLLNPIFLHRRVESRQLMDVCTYLSYRKIKKKKIRKRDIIE